MDDTENTQNPTFVLAALGGLDEIGLNAMAYGFGPEGDREWILVDCGLTFTSGSVPGVDLVFPDVSYLQKRRDKLLGIVITHAHEDHIGALADLWPSLGAPIFATPFATNLMEVRRFGDIVAQKPQFNMVDQGQTITLGSFSIEFIPVCHSIPESCALAITTPLGTVVHTGDWKLDPDPHMGKLTDEKRLREIGDAGVLALVCDSTNILRDGISPSEGEVAKTLADIIRDAPARVAVTTFASNVARLKLVAEAAVECGREVVIVGRAMERTVEIARNLGYLDGLPAFKGIDAYKTLPPSKIVALLTGSQGEPRAALWRIAHDDHPDISLSPNDTVIFSSRTIPGNEREVGTIINQLIRDGVHVITDRTDLVHASGHPRQGEVAQMYEWVRPHVAIPAHGEALHLKEHADFAKAQGIPQVILARNGDLVQLAPAPSAIVKHIPTGRLYKDGDLVVRSDDVSIPERSRLGLSGIVSVALALDRRGKLAGELVLEMSGVPQTDANNDSIPDQVAQTIEQTLHGLNASQKRDLSMVEGALTRAIRGTIGRMWGKKPTCHVMVVLV
jgi:ribonuclease J